MTDRIKALRDIVEADQEDALARFMLGKELLDHGRPTEAAAEFDMAVRLDPDHTASWRWYGQALEAAGMKDHAARVYRLGIEVAQRTRDLQAGKEMKVFLARLEK
jgi:Flp pilus assembly protein TadD